MEQYSLFKHKPINILEVSFKVQHVWHEMKLFSFLQKMHNNNPNRICQNNKLLKDVVKQFVDA